MIIIIIVLLILLYHIWNKNKNYIINFYYINAFICFNKSKKLKDVKKEMWEHQKYYSDN
ncbi:hypothetical protein PBNK65E_000404000 [Plasmodium berghei]|uniref:Uncharacterized protein n=10 Tax=Plasmodium (Vinckeia) TaxID=418101 RepID=A0A509APA6_PLABA|nr:conserved Plasmodium protein, unknown function [Plasmodium chabaudi chabaudi]XP_022813727.1 conserved Plasmodium protein, unknown function [Plasmodium yoelii]XP_034423693.1 conserved Plasmodium protein, unknown function [Plasmodium berghei ANKA]XP_037490837.1 conserved Plasmodium protein, unknown function [Plasmodium vinckei vinckei]CAD2098487.1 conserved Plasmodium protein, unknown function [Plasmodium vinckei petteri]CAD2098874.1 conserved Plasmodium protein, unknown function [Plasmodium |eukprot:XP_034423693.1 conserved Plasmodium protein, unknown function [Plasmodium berghei ANKA]